MDRPALSLRVQALLALALLVAGCSQSARTGSASVLGDQAVTVASFDFSESVLLGEIYAQALERRGYQVQRAFDLGPRELVEPALERGLVEFVPEYLGAALSFVTMGETAPSPNAVLTHEALSSALAPRRIAVLGFAPAQDANGIAVTEATAEHYHLERISDLIPVAAELVFGGPPECPTRPLCLAGLEEVYGLRFEQFVPLDASGPFTVTYLANGQIDVALMFTTDGDVAAHGFRLLVDDRGLQPAENVTPLIRHEALDRFGEGLASLIDRVSSALTTEDLLAMNREVDGGLGPDAVAREWLVDQGLVG